MIISLKQRKIKIKPRIKLNHNINARGGGGGGYSHTLPIRVCATQRSRDFEAPDLELGIHFRSFF